MEDDSKQTPIAMGDELEPPMIRLEDDPRCEDRKHGIMVIPGKVFAVGIQMSFAKDTGYCNDAFLDRLRAMVDDAFRAEMLSVAEDFDQLPPFRDPLPANASPEERNKPSPRTLNLVAWIE